MDWQKEMDELRRREAFAEELGGPERVARQHAGGRLTIRERVARPAVDGWDQVVTNMGTIPRVALGLGSVAGLGAAHLAAAHYSVMIKDKSAMFVAGPPVVERLGQKLTKNELGGWEIQLKAGGVDDAVETEDEAFER